MTTNFERTFAERPDAYDAWRQLNGAISRSWASPSGSSTTLVVGRPIAEA